MRITHVLNRLNFLDGGPPRRWLRLCEAIRDQVSDVSLVRPLNSMSSALGTVQFLLSCGQGKAGRLDSSRLWLSPCANVFKTVVSTFMVFGRD